MKSFISSWRPWVRPAPVSPSAGPALASATFLPQKSRVWRERRGQPRCRAGLCLWELGASASWVCPEPAVAAVSEAAGRKRASMVDASAAFCSLRSVGITSSLRRWCLPRSLTRAAGAASVSSELLKAQAALTAPSHLHLVCRSALHACCLAERVAFCLASAVRRWGGPSRE